MSSKIPFSWKGGSKGNGSRILAREDPEGSLKHRVWFLAVLRLLHQCRQIIKISKLQLQIALHSALFDASKQSQRCWCWCRVSQCRIPCVAMASCRTLATSVRMAVSRPCNAATLAGSMRVNQLAKNCKGLCNAAHCSAFCYSSFWSYLNILYLNIIFLMLFVGITSLILIATYFQPPMPNRHNRRLRRKAP